MLNIPRLPKEARLTIAPHIGLEQPPVVVYEPLDAESKIRWQAELFLSAREEAEIGPAPEIRDAEGNLVPQPPRPKLTKAEKLERHAAETRVYVGIFAERVKRWEGLGVEGEPYDHANVEHRRAIELDHQVEIGIRILTASRLTEAEQGKSSSPSE